MPGRPGSSAGADVSVFSPPRASTPDEGKPAAGALPPMTPKTEMRKDAIERYTIAFKESIDFLKEQRIDELPLDIKSQVIPTLLTKINRLVQKEVAHAFIAQGNLMIGKTLSQIPPGTNFRFTPGETETLVEKIHSACEHLASLNQDSTAEDVNVMKASAIIALQEGVRAIGLDGLFIPLGIGAPAEFDAAADAVLVTPPVTDLKDLTRQTPRTKKVVAIRQIMAGRFKELVKFYQSEDIRALVKERREATVNGQEMEPSDFYIATQAMFFDLVHELVDAETSREFGRIGTEIGEKANGEAYPEGVSNDAFTFDHYQRALENIYTACLQLTKVEHGAKIHTAKRKLIDSIGRLKEATTLLGVEKQFSKFDISFLSSTDGSQLGP